MSDEPKTKEKAEAPPAAESEVEKLRKEAAANLDLAKRSQAELVNVQDRMRRDVDATRRFAVEALVAELLPVLDTLGKAIQTGAASPMLDAVKLIEKETLRVLAKFGVTPIETKGQKFNPLYHEALSLVESPDHEDQAILTEARRGYMMYDRVLRAAHVVVAKGKKKADPATPPA